MSPVAATLACVLVGLAAALAVPGRPRVSTTITLRPPGGSLVLLASASVVTLAVVLGLPTPWVLLAGVGAAVAGWGRTMLTRHRARRARTRTAEEVLEACEALAAELAAGSPSGRALGRAAEACPALGGAVEAARWSADVPSALRRAAGEPGAEDLRLLAAAWQVAHRSGQGLATTIDRIVLRLRAERRTRRIVDSELASARSTARLVSALPLVAWGMGAGAGAAPWEFLVSGPVGLAVLVAGLALLLGGLWWIEVLADRVWRP